MRNNRALIVVVLLLTAVSTGLADDELTPHVGVRLGGDLEAEAINVDSLKFGPVYGLTYAHRLRDQGWLWSAWSVQPTEFDAPGLLPDRDTIDLDIHYLHVGTSYRPVGKKRTQGFVMFGFGLTWLDPPAEFDAELGASLLVGGGFRTPLKPKIDLRFDVRGYITFTDTELKGQCGGVACSIDFAGGGVLQVDLLVGVSFGF